MQNHSAVHQTAFAPQQRARSDTGEKYWESRNGKNPLESTTPLRFMRYFILGSRSRDLIRAGDTPVGGWTGQFVPVHRPRPVFCNNTICTVMVFGLLEDCGRLATATV